MGIIIFNIFTILICLIALLLDIIVYKDTKAAIFMGILVALNFFFMCINIQKYTDKKNGIEPINTTIVKDVKGYQIDSTIVINSTDTTKTYVLTYWK